MSSRTQSARSGAMRALRMTLLVALLTSSIPGAAFGATADESDAEEILTEITAGPSVPPIEEVDLAGTGPGGPAPEDPPSPAPVASQPGTPPEVQAASNGYVYSHVISKTVNNGCTMPTQHTNYGIRDPYQASWIHFHQDSAWMDIRRVYVNEDVWGQSFETTQRNTAGAGDWCWEHDQPIDGSFFQARPGHWRIELYFADSTGAWIQQGSPISFTVYPILIDGGVYRDSPGDGVTTFSTSEPFVNVYTGWDTSLARSSGHTLRYHWYRDAWTEHAVNGAQSLPSGYSYVTLTNSLDIQSSGAWQYPGTWTVRPWLDTDTNYLHAAQYTFTLTTAPPPCGNPSVSLGPSSQSGVAPYSATFTASATPASGCSISSYVMNFGNGEDVSGSGSPPSSFSTTYGSAGSYTATLTVTQSDQKSSSATASISVSSANVCETPGPDAAGYSCAMIPVAFSDISLLGTSIALGDDQVSGAIPIGFTFNFYGNPYTSVYVSSNGFITFDATSSSGCCSGEALPSATSPSNLIAGFWEDLYPPGGGTIKYRTNGLSPNRELIVQWTNVPHHASGNLVTFQIRLFEGSNKIEIHANSAPSDGGTHVTGIENAGGSTGLRYRYGNFALSNLAIRFTAPGFPPSAPQGLTLTTPAAEQIRLDWSAPATSGSSAVSGYRIYGGASQPLSYLGQVSASQRTFTHTGLIPQQYTYEVSAVNGVGEGARSAQRSVRAYHQYDVELRAWIPHNKVVDPKMPLERPYDANAIAWDGGYCHPHAFWTQGPYAVEGWFKGDGHTEYEGAFRVKSGLSFRWDGSSITNVVQGTSNFGTTERMRHYKAIGSDHTCVLTAKTATTQSDPSASGTTFRLHYSSENPVTASDGANSGQYATPAIDGHVDGLFLSDGRLQLTYQTDEFPSHGLRVARNGAEVLRIYSTDASCFSNSNVMGPDGAYLLWNALRDEQSTRTATIGPADSWWSASYPSEAC